MNHFEYRDDEIHAEDVPLAKIAQAVGTPFYCYSTATLERHYRVFSSALAGIDAQVCFAVKANSNQSVLMTLAKMGCGADVVSEGELRRALQAGVAPKKIVFSGVGKSKEEIRAALSNGILQINCESEAELAMISAVAQAEAVQAPVTIRVNPDVDAGTMDKISTGRKEDKFGIPIGRASQIYQLARALPNLKVVGVSVHIGSQITDLKPFEAAFGKTVELVGQLRTEGHEIKHLDLGGGLGIPYNNEMPPSPTAYGEMIARVTKDVGCKILLEPGRLICGNAGIMATRVLYVKETEQRKFVIVDAAMNDLMRPALYGAFHQILPLKKPHPETQSQPVDIVGPVCETTDIFCKQRPMTPVKPGDILVFGSAGAYGAVMSSFYNTRALIPEVLVKGNQFAVVRPRLSIDQLIGLDRTAPWLEDLDQMRLAVAT